MPFWKSTLKFLIHNLHINRNIKKRVETDIIMNQSVVYLHREISTRNTLPDSPSVIIVRIPTAINIHD